MPVRVTPALARKLGVKRSKYGVRYDAEGRLRRTRDGILFDSEREAKRWDELKLLECAGNVEFLERQKKLPLRVKGRCGYTELGYYAADFYYWDEGREQWVYEDVKGVRTPLYKWKKRHAEAQYGITIVEV